MSADVSIAALGRELGHAPAVPGMILELCLDEDEESLGDA